MGVCMKIEGCRPRACKLEAEQGNHILDIRLVILDYRDSSSRDGKRTIAITTQCP